MRNEYPRPDFIRAQWLSLNGRWDFTEDVFPSEKMSIEVPFVPQCTLSGLKKTLTSDRIVYERLFNVPEQWRGQRILLHFGAVDYKCTVWVNDHCVGSHQGGQTPFQFDITDYLHGGSEQLKVCVTDYLHDECIPRGKQFWEPEGKFIWYTPSSGIWQSVWLEPVSEAHIRQIHFTPDIDEGTVTINYRVSEQTQCPYRLKFTIRFEKQIVDEIELRGNDTKGRLIVDVFQKKALRGAFHFTGWYWSPEQPSLFDVTAELYCGEQCTDHIETYFGMRKIEVKNGSVYLNNRPYYQKLVLDQGYWKDSLITAPEASAFSDDILKAKAMGFNGCRKHEKVEDPLFLYWADHLGFLVWESMSSFWSFNTEYAGAFVDEWKDVIRRDYNHPCIVVWNMMNESWGVPHVYDHRQQQHFVNCMYHLAHSLDATRLVIGNDGWEMTETDICAVHSYKHGKETDKRQQRLFAEGIKSLEGMEKLVEKPIFANGYAYKNQPVILTETGGITMTTGGNGQADGWGYTETEDEKSFLAEYERLIRNIYDADRLCGFCYTQLTDVQQEKNGLLDEDHEWKMDGSKIRAINDGMPTSNVFFMPLAKENENG
jgi:beta-galactosidase/beta-glucuronidase